jgi:hypothetical protein
MFRSMKKHPALSPLTSLAICCPLLLSMTQAQASPSPARSKVPAPAQTKSPATAKGSGNSRSIKRGGPSFNTQKIKDKWALVIGISKFAHPEYNLKYAAKDAADFKDFLIKECAFAPDHVKFLENERATRGAIMDAFGDNWLPRVVIPGDLVIIYISTHGTPASRDAGGRNYIVAHDTDWNRLFSEGVEMNSLAAQIKERVNTDRVLIVMDTCYSGAATTGARGIEKPANFDADEIAQGTGRLVLSSSSPNERSWEGAGYKNGIFTFNLIKALRKNNGNIDVLTAFSDVRKNVQWEAQSNFGAPQTPALGGKWEGVNLVLSLPPAEPRGLPDSLREIPTSFDFKEAGPLRSDDLAAMCIEKIEMAGGQPGLYPVGSEMVVPGGQKRALLLGGIGTTSEVTLRFGHPLETFSLTRPGVTGGSSTPKWRLDAYSVTGQIVATTGEATFGFDAQPKTFTVSGKEPISYVRLSYDNRNTDGSPWSTYNSLPIVKFEHTHFTFASH